MGYIMSNSMWRTDGFNRNYLRRKVEKINICAYYPYQSSPEYPSTNNWVMFLQHSPTGSVKVNMSAGLGGVVEVSSKDYTHTNQAVHTFSLDPTHEWTVQDLINLIIREELYRYDFTEEGHEGCRFWNFTVIEYLERNGQLSAGTAKSVWETLSYYYSDSGEPLPREIKRGSFV